MIRKFSYPHPHLKHAAVVFLVEFGDSLSQSDTEKLNFILNPSFQPSNGDHVLATSVNKTKFIGPNLRFETPESEKLCAICNSFGLAILQIEEFVGYNAALQTKLECDQAKQSLYEALPVTLKLNMKPAQTRIVNLLDFGKIKLEEINKELGFGMDVFDIDYYYNLFVKKYQRNPTDVELAQLAQANSSHSRHWEWNGRFVIDGVPMQKTLFQLVKETLEHSPKGNVLGFKDNGGILEGGWTEMFIPDKNGVCRKVRLQMNHTLTAETHNHPSLIEPYAGAATGVGGRERDTPAILIGSLISFGGVYFQTGRPWLDGNVKWKYPKNMANPRKVLPGIILGASGYGNPFGEPTLLFGHDAPGIILPDGQRFESIKPNVYTCGIGSIPANSQPKAKPESGMKVVRIGGKTWRVGVGGGAASSMNAGSNTTELDFKSVQRGEPMMGRCAYNVIEHCVLMLGDNPILAIHDQGAGGASNMLTELVNPVGGTIYMRKMRIGDASLSQLEAWISESQELYGILIAPEKLELFQSICSKFECPIEILGDVNNSAKIVVIDELDNSIPVNLTLPEILGDLPQKTYEDNTVSLPFNPFSIPEETVGSLLEKVLAVPGVGLLNYMVDHFDGSVGGKTVQGPRDGIFQLPICPYGISTQSLSGVTGSLSTISRTNPVAMLINEKATTRMAIAQMIATMAFVLTPGGIEKMKGRWNVMWPFKMPGMKARLWHAYNAGVEALKETGFGINGGKDSLSMSVSFEEEIVASFPTFIFLPEAHVADVRHRVTPALKGTDGNTELVLIELEKCKYRMGGSALAEATDQTGSEVPDADPQKVVQAHKLIQRLIRKGLIIAGMPKQKGGLLTTVAKMASANKVSVHVTSPLDVFDTPFYFNEEFGVIVECKKGYAKKVLGLIKGFRLIGTRIGEVKAPGDSFEFTADGVTYTLERSDIQNYASRTSKEIKKQLLGIPASIVEKEVFAKQNYKLTFNPDKKLKIHSRKKFKVAVLAAPGTNGQTELGYFLGKHTRRFEVTPIQMNELHSGKYNLKDFNVVLFAGGFSYGDVGGSGKGWAASILFNEKLKKMFDDFFARPDTLSFGVCNGFQLATHLGILDASLGQKPSLLHNDSGIFEHRLVNLFIQPNSTSIMFKNMGGSVLPAWSAQGEGKPFLPQGNYEDVAMAGLVPLHYVDEFMNIRCDYGPNPNGSPLGIAGLCTKDGRHTFMMPHIERFGSAVHMPYKPEGWNFKNQVWDRAAENMYAWLCENA